MNYKIYKVLFPDAIYDDKEFSYILYPDDDHCNLKNIFEYISLMNDKQIEDIQILYETFTTNIKSYLKTFKFPSHKFEITEVDIKNIRKNPDKIYDIIQSL